MLEKLLNKLPHSREELIDDFAKLSYRAVVQNPLIRGAVYAYIYIAAHNDQEALVPITYGVIGFEALMHLITYYNEKGED